jgi:hypothetical protein
MSNMVFSAVREIRSTDPAFSIPRRMPMRPEKVVPTATESGRCPEMLQRGAFVLIPLEGKDDAFRCMSRLLADNVVSTGYATG